MGYLYQAVALKGRYKRRRASWQQHLEKSRTFIVETAGKCLKRGKVVILGSGLLLDVPLSVLSKVFDEVVLVDVIHLPEVVKRTSDYPNVRLVQSDITGVAEKLFHNIGQGDYGLPESVPCIPEIDEKTSLVISLNIVSQLSAIPVDYVMKNTNMHDEAALQAWCDQIRGAHFAALQALSCDVCLIADYEFTRRDAKGKIIESGSTVGNLSFPEPDRSWTWYIAPCGEEAKGCSKELHVGAWHIIKG
jgi:uncharacterized UPF0146 family protein